MSRRKLKILIIVITYNAMRWAEHCFNSLRDSTITPDIFVVDNGSIDGTQQYIKEHNPEVHFVQSEKNLGFGKANNIGLQYALDNDYDYVYLLNQDAWVMPDTFEKLIDVSKKHPDYGVLSPMQMQANLDCFDDNFLEHALCRLLNKKQYERDITNRTFQDIYQTEFVMAAH